MGGGGSWKEISSLWIEMTSHEDKIWNQWIHSNNAMFNFQNYNLLLKHLNDTLSRENKETLWYYFTSYFLIQRHWVLKLSKYFSYVKSHLQNFEGDQDQIFFLYQSHKIVLVDLLEFFLDFQKVDHTIRKHHLNPPAIVLNDMFTNNNQ